MNVGVCFCIIVSMFLWMFLLLINVVSDLLICDSVVLFFLLCFWNVDCSVVCIVSGVVWVICLVYLRVCVSFLLGFIILVSRCMCRVLLVLNLLLVRM